MSETIIREWYFLLCSMLAGIFFAFVYDQIRLLRRLWRHGRMLVDVEDILYWIFCFLVSFYLLYYGNYGVVRFVAVLGAALGMFFLQQNSWESLCKRLVLYYYVFTCAISVYENDVDSYQKSFYNKNERFDESETWRGGETCRETM